ncbi:hypothetical protein [Actinoplanes teichomyceticus]|uniref:hypothetical protein n=1 Tax=Actinoplanes teichomyceticus TaxID=1867 RepID=UPI0011EAB0D2|nr:hypothetical protein [Actinoplanes teichomyceticus]
MTTQEPYHPQTADQPLPDTEVIAVATPVPVFVDSTGRRSRLLRRIALAFGILVVSYGGLVSVSLAGGPVRSSAVLPLPGVDDKDARTEPVPPRPSPAPEASPSSAPSRRPVIESVTRANREPVRHRSATATPTPSATSEPAKTRGSSRPTPAASTAKPSVSATRPTESTTTQPTTAPTKTSEPPPAPVPPAGGAGGGDPIDGPAQPATRTPTAANGPATRTPTAANGPATRTPAGGDPAGAGPSAPGPSASASRPGEPA